jgi:hypothetical protein
MNRSRIGLVVHMLKLRPERGVRRHNQKAPTSRLYPASSLLTHGRQKEGSSESNSNSSLSESPSNAKPPRERCFFFFFFFFFYSGAPRWGRAPDDAHRRHHREPKQQRT